MLEYFHANVLNASPLPVTKDVLLEAPPVDGDDK